MRAIQKIIKNRKGVCFAYLYGSFAEGKRFEDIDLALAPEKKITEKTKGRLIAKIEKELAGLKIKAPRTESTFEFGFWDLHWLDELPLPIQYRVMQEGKLVCERHPQSRLQWETKTMREYLDFEPFYHRVMYKAMEKMSQKL